MDNTEQLLSQLKDIHLPNAVNMTAWPLGRSILLSVVFLIVITGLIFFWRRKIKANRRAKLLAQLHELYTKKDFAGLSVFLKRVALRAYPLENIGSLQGQEWLAFLDRTDEKNAEPRFQSKVGELLLALPYQRINSPPEEGWHYKPDGVVKIALIPSPVSGEGAQRADEGKISTTPPFGHPSSGGGFSEPALARQLDLTQNLFKIITRWILKHYV